MAVSVNVAGLGDSCPFCGRKVVGIEGDSTVCEVGHRLVNPDRKDQLYVEGDLIKGGDW